MSFDSSLTPVFGKEAETIQRLIAEEIFTRDQIEEFREMFDLFDSDRTEKVDLTHIAEMVKMTLEPMGEESMTDIMSSLMSRSIEDSSKVDFPDFLTILEKITVQVPDSSEEVLEAFRVFDINGDGFASAEALEYFLTEVGEPLSSSEWAELIKISGVELDGTILYEDFVTHVSRKVLMIHQMAEKEEEKKRRKAEKELEERENQESV